MGIPPEPPPEFNNAIPECFPVNQTPVVVIVSFVGIEVSPLISPPPPPPPNGIWILNLNASEQYYQAWHGEWLIYWDPLYNGGSLCGATWMGSLLGFIEYTSENCDMFFTSELTDPYYSTYINGYADVLAINLYPLDISVPDVASLLSIPIDEHTKFDFWPVSDTQSVVRFARYHKSMNILLKLENGT